MSRMARRNKNKPKLLDGALSLLAHLPWWLCLGLSVVSFVYFRTIDTTPKTTNPANAVQVAEMIESGIMGGLVLVAQHALPILFLAAAGLSFFARAHRKALLRRVEQARSLEALQLMTWQEFELLVGEAFRRRGFGIIEQGGEGPDGGVDLVLNKAGKRYLVQCKQWKVTSVGVDIVRQHYGVMAAARADGGFVITSGRFTDAARQFAHGRVTLIDGSELFNMIQETRGGNPGPLPAPRAPAPIPATVRDTAPAGMPVDTNPKPVECAPACPRCNSAMALRTSRKGPTMGNQFWGCTRFPTCRGVRQA